MSGEEIDATPDPELFRDAWELARHGVWTPTELDEADALLVALIRKMRNVKVKRS